MKKFKVKYIVLVYLLLAAIAAILFVLSFEKGDIRTVALSFATELFAVTFVFFLVDFIFSVRDWDLSELVQALLKQLQEERPSALNFFQKLPNLIPYIENANKIDLCGVSLTSTLDKLNKHFQDSLTRGAEINILIMDPDSHAPEMSSQRSFSSIGEDYFRSKLANSFKEIEFLNHKLADLPEAKKGKLAVRLIPYAPSFGLISFNANQSDGNVFVEIYPNQSYKQQPAFELNLDKDGEWYNFFVEQFNQMWQVAKPWTPTSIG